MTADRFDGHALIARLRAGDDEALNEAYRLVFGGEMGRLVLADLAREAGVGGKYGGHPDLYSVGYHQGGHDLAVDLMGRAGLDQASAITMVLNGRLEGSEDERSAQPDPGTYAEPDPEFGD